MLSTISKKDALLINSTSVTGLLTQQSENTFNGHVGGFDIATKWSLYCYHFLNDFSFDHCHIFPAKHHH